MAGKKQEKFIEKWGYQRSGGILYTIIRVGFSMYVLCLFGQLVYQTVIQDFSSFPFYPAFIVISIVVALAYWFFNEKRYKKLTTKAQKKR